MYYRAYILSLVVLCGVLVLHVLGNDHGLFVRYRLYDILPHFCGGLGAGLFMAGFIRVRTATGRFLPKYQWMIVGFVFVVAVAWEIFEIYTNTAGYVLWTAAYYADTLKDISMGVIGSIIAALIAGHIFKDASPRHG